MAIMGRPRKLDPRARVRSAKLNEAEHEEFDRLLADRAAEVRTATGQPSLSYTDGDLIRWLVHNEALRRGIANVDPADVARSEAVAKSDEPTPPKRDR